MRKEAFVLVMDLEMRGSSVEVGRWMTMYVENNPGFWAEEKR